MLALGLIATGSAAGAASSAPELLVDSTAVRAGDAVHFTGRGFAMPPVDACEIRAAVAVEWDCTFDDYAFGDFQLSEEVDPGSYDVTVCAPSCAAPWGGSTTATLTVQDDETEPTDAVTPQVGAFELVPNPAFPGELIVIEAAPVGAVIGDCTAGWAGERKRVGTCTADDDGVVTGVITAPDVEVTGDRTLTVCRPTCADPVGGTARTVVRVETVPVGGTASTDPSSASPTTTATSAGPTGVGAGAGGVAGGASVVLLSLGVVVLLGLAAATGGWALHAPPRPSVQLVPDDHPALVVTLVRPARAAPTLRLRGFRDVQPSIVLEEDTP